MPSSSSKKGIASLAVMIIVLATGIVAASGAALVSLNSQQIIQSSIRSAKSFYASESGMEDAVYRVKHAMPYLSNYSLTVDAYTTDIIVTSQGDLRSVESQADVNNVVKKLKTNLILATSVDASFLFGAQVGYLGLEMDNTSRIIGSVYSNGSVEINNSASITGDVWVARGTASSPDQQQTTSTAAFIIRNAQNNQDGAQSFVPTITAEVNKVAIYIRKVSNPGDLTIRILPDAGGHPDDTGSMASGNLSASLVGSTFSWVEVTLNSNQALIQNQPYWLIIDNNAWQATRYYELGIDSDSAYTQGTFAYTQNWATTNALWTGINQDIAFKIYMGSVDSYIDGGPIGGNAHAHTIQNSQITGDAYYQTIANTTVGGISYPGSPDPDPQNMPLSQSKIDEFKAQGDGGGVCAPPICEVNGDLDLDNDETATLGPTNITGDMRINNRSILTITGTLHVMGDATISNNCVIKLDPAYGNTSGVIIVDGQVDISNQCQLLGSGEDGSYLMIISTSTLLSGPPAMRVDNNSSGAIFYTSQGTLEISNTADLKEAVGQKLHLRNGATLTYESGLANVDFSSGAGGTFEILNWKEI